MKRFLSVLLASAVIGFAAMPADAALIDRGGGLIYDDDLNITWLQDANYAQTSGHDADGRMTWSVATSWADGLVYGGYDDWRLPTALNQDGSGPCSGYNCTGSEMGHLFYTELGNLGYYNTSGVYQPGYGLANTGPFDNLLSGVYWSGTGSYYAWDFRFNFGGQFEDGTYNTYYAMAVRDGDVAGGGAAPVPEPSTMLLLGGGIAGLALARRRFRK